MRVAVIGSSGNMGSFFVRRFLESGNEVRGADPRAPGSAAKGFTFVKTNCEAVKGADAVLLSVPIDAIVKVGREIAPCLAPGAAVLEISSVKTGVRRGLREAFRKKEVSLISIHPMFGPSSRSASPRIIVIGGPGEARTVRGLMPWAHLVPLKDGDHDRAMAYALSLVHVLNLAFVSALAKGIGVDQYRKISSPLGSTQLNVAEAVLSQDPYLCSLIQTENPFAGDAISSLVDELRILGKMVEAKDGRGFRRHFASLANRFPEKSLADSVSRVYSSTEGSA